MLKEKVFPKNSAERLSKIQNDNLCSMENAAQNIERYVQGKGLPK